MTVEMKWAEVQDGAAILAPPVDLVELQLP